MTDQSWPTAIPVLRHVRCESCKRDVTLECKGLGGVVMYETYNEYFCPYCRKQNMARTPGQIIAARADLVHG